MGIPAGFSLASPFPLTSLPAPAARVRLGLPGWTQERFIYMPAAAGVELILGSLSPLRMEKPPGLQRILMQERDGEKAKNAADFTWQRVEEIPDRRELIWSNPLEVNGT